MALKDWKKVGMLEWKKKKAHILISKDVNEKYAKYPFKVLYYQDSYSSMEMDDLFYAESISQAIKYAKSYMKKH